MPIPVDTPLEAQERLDLMDLMDTGPYAIPFRQLDVNLIIATWNIQNLSEKKSWRALKYMADIIERFDFTIVSVHIFDSSSYFKEREIDSLADAIRKLSRRERSKVVDRDIGFSTH